MVVEVRENTSVSVGTSSFLRKKFNTFEILASDWTRTYFFCNG